MRKYQVVSAVPVNTDTLQLNLKLQDSWKPFKFYPGQYAAISFFNHGRPTAARCFSITSSPNDIENLQFTMRTNGRYTNALRLLQPGDKVNVRGPFGGFILNTLEDGDVVLLAGGIGITPFMSMIRYAADIKYSKTVTLIYSCHSQDDIPFFEEIAQVKNANPNFKIVYAIGDGPVDKLGGYAVKQGRISPDVIDYATDKNWNDKVFFICGPPPFMRGMLAELKDHGVPKSRIKTEAFSQGKNKQTGKVKSWPNNMYALTAVGMGLGSFVVMATDMFNTMPPSTLIGPKNVTTQKKLYSQREVDIDDLVNSFAGQDTGSKPTGAAAAASQVAASAPQPGAPAAAAPGQTTAAAPSGTTARTATGGTTTRTTSGATTGGASTGGTTTGGSTGGTTGGTTTGGSTGSTTGGTTTGGSTGGTTGGTTTGGGTTCVSTPSKPC